LCSDTLRMVDGELRRADNLNADLGRKRFAARGVRGVEDPIRLRELIPTNAMREFLRALAWRMYEEGRDSMDPTEVLPFLQTFFPGRNEAELAELAEVAVVNSPEITKGEQTGFEFVHKSFAEYLTAEEVAITVERVTFEAPEFGTEQLTWRMTENEASNEVAKCTAIRVLTAEVQEMLEPMLGDFEGFFRALNNREEYRQRGLNRIIRRFENSAR
jgi:hypothetical protein